MRKESIVEVTEFFELLEEWARVEELEFVRWQLFAKRDDSLQQLFLRLRWQELGGVCGGVRYVLSFT